MEKCMITCNCTTSKARKADENTMVSTNRLGRGSPARKDINVRSNDPYQRMAEIKMAKP